MLRVIVFDPIVVGLWSAFTKLQTFKAIYINTANKIQLSCEVNPWSEWTFCVRFDFNVMLNPNEININSPFPPGIYLVYHELHIHTVRERERHARCTRGTRSPWKSFKSHLLLNSRYRELENRFQFSLIFS